MPMTGYIDKNPPVVSALWFNLADATKNLFTDAGTVNALNIQSGIPGGLPLSTDMNLSILVANTNTGPVVLTVDTNPQTAVKNPDGTPVALAQLHAGGIVTVKFDGTFFQVISATDALFGNGSASSPSIAFNSSPGTGFYLPVPDTLGAATAGTLRWTTNSVGNTTFNPPDLTAPVPFPTVTMYSSGIPGQPALALRNDALNGFALHMGNINDAAGAEITLDWICGSTPATQLGIGAYSSNMNTVTSDFLGVTGPSCGIGMFANKPASFGIFVGNEFRLVLPGTVGQGVFCYSANAGTFSDITTDRGSFTGTLTGMTTTVTGQVNWIRRGTEVEIYFTAGITGTSNTTALTLTGIPAIIQPASLPGINSQHVAFFGLLDAGSTQMGVMIPGGTGSLSFNTLHAVGANLVTDVFTNSGTKGFSAGTSFKFKTQANF